MIKRKLIALTIIFAITFVAANHYTVFSAVNHADMTKPVVDGVAIIKQTQLEKLYTETGLYKHVSKDIFNQAMTGFDKLDPKKPVLAIADFSKPSNKKRLTVVNLLTKEILFHTYVAHGKNSGGLYATDFSNKEGSLKSSLGFYKAGGTINSKKFGYSMLLHGLEKGINDNVRQREIIMHPSTYVTEARALSGKMGRSYGCPALPPKMSKPIIDALKNGGLLFVSANNANYQKRSEILN